MALQYLLVITIHNSIFLLIYIMLIISRHLIRVNGLLIKVNVMYTLLIKGTQLHK